MAEVHPPISSAPRRASANDLAKASARTHRATKNFANHAFVPSKAKHAVGNTTAAEVFPPEVLKSLEPVLGPPAGDFMKGRNGVTHYVMEEPDASVAKTPRDVVCCAHGLGTNLHVYDALARDLLLAGFTVLRYEYFNHGYSKSDDTFLVIDENVMVSQVEDLLNHVLEDGEHLHNFVGHSTGGVVAIMAARSLPNRKIDHLGLISPAVWANKPLIAKLGERVPSFLFNLMKWGFKPMDFAVSDSYTQNCHVAFARDKKTKEYRYEAAYKKCLAGTKATFAVHPYYTAGIMSISNFYLNDSLLPLWRDYHKEISAKGVRSNVVYGDEDIVVPNLGTLSTIENTVYTVLPQQGHECLYENTATVSPVLIEFFNDR